MSLFSYLIALISLPVFNFLYLPFFSPILIFGSSFLFSFSVCSLFFSCFYFSYLLLSSSVFYSFSLALLSLFFFFFFFFPDFNAPISSFPFSSLFFFHPQFLILVSPSFLFFPFSRFSFQVFNARISFPLLPVFVFVFSSPVSTARLSSFPLPSPRPSSPQPASRTRCPRATSQRFASVSRKDFACAKTPRLGCQSVLADNFSLDQYISRCVLVKPRESCRL